MITEINFNEQDNETLLLLIKEAEGYHETFVSLNAPKETLDDINERIQTMRAILQNRRKAVATEGQSEKKPIYSSSLKSQIPMKQTSTTQAQPQAKTAQVSSHKIEVERKIKDRPFDANDARRYRSLITDLQVQLKSWMLIKKENKPYLRAKHKNIVCKKFSLIFDHVNSRCLTLEWKKYLFEEASYSSCFEKKRFFLNLDRILKDFDLRD
jgi:hypothetical protein